MVIPKEIRRTLKIRESEPLEIFTDRNGEIILKKYSPIGEFSSGAQQLADAAAKTCGKLFCICDQEQVVAAAGPENKKYQGKSLSKAMEQRLFDRDFIPENNAYYPVTDDDAHTEQALVPVTRDGDPVGAVCFLGMKRIDDIQCNNKAEHQYLLPAFRLILFLLIIFFQCQPCKCQVQRQRPGYIPDMPGLPSISGYMLFPFRIAQDEAI